MKGYEGEWPLWASFRESKPALDSIDAVAPAGQPTNDAVSKDGEKDSRSYVCAPVGECEGCPEDVVCILAILNMVELGARGAD